MQADDAVLPSITMEDIQKMIAVTHTGMSTEAFERTVANWLDTALQPRFQKHYTELIYQPMLEVIAFLKQHQFKVYIVSGGGQDFIRVFSPQTYDIPVTQVIGSILKTKYIKQNGKTQLIKQPELLIYNDKSQMPESIHMFIGEKPLIAFGNSDGDREMLEWTQSGRGKRLMLLVHHDDADREYKYGAKSKVGTFSDALMQEANANHWAVISMKNDWNRIFPFNAAALKEHHKSNGQ